LREKKSTRKRLYWPLQRLCRLHRTFFFLRKNRCFLMFYYMLYCTLYHCGCCAWSLPSGTCVLLYVL
jgi:hypothetical protein